MLSSQKKEGCGNASLSSKMILAALMLAAIICLGGVLGGSDDSEAADYGTTGGCSWSFDGVDELTISGSGAMTSYYYSYYPPWKNLPIKSVVIDDQVTSIGDYAFIDCTTLTNVTIGSSVRSIGCSAFKGCTSLERVDLPDSVETIGTYAFLSCGHLETVTFGSSVESIDNSAFESCVSLKNLILPDSLKTLGQSAFRSCADLETLIVGSSLENIPFQAFNDCISLKSVTLSDSVTYIDNYAFSECSNLETLDLGSSIETIGWGAFSGCGLNQVDFPDSVRTIGDNSFYSCGSLKTVKLGPSVQYIGRAAFEYCTSLEELDLGTSPANIEYQAFGYCESLQHVVIPETASYISHDAFHKCDGIKTLAIYNDDISIDYGSFGNLPKLEKLVCSDRVARYVSAYSENMVRYDGCTISQISVRAGNYLVSLTGPGIKDLAPGSLTAEVVPRENLPQLFQEAMNASDGALLVKVDGSSDIPSGVKLIITDLSSNNRNRMGISYFNATADKLVSINARTVESYYNDEYVHSVMLEPERLGMMLVTSGYSSLGISDAEFLAMVVAVLGTVIIAAAALVGKKRRPKEGAVSHNPMIKEFEQNIANRGDRDVIVNGFSAIIVILFPIIVTVAAALLGANMLDMDTAIADGSLNVMIILLDAFVLESFVIMALIYKSYSRLRAHSRRDHEWAESLKDAVRKMGGDYRQLDGYLEKKRFPLIVPVLLLVAIMIVYSTYMIISIPLLNDGQDMSDWVGICFLGGVILCIITYLLTLSATIRYPARHEKEQVEFTEKLAVLLRDRGIEIPPLCPVIRPRNFAITVLLTFVTLGIYAVWCVLRSYVDMNNHIKSQWMYEDELLLTLESRGKHQFDRDYFPKSAYDNGKDGYKMLRKRQRAIKSESKKRGKIPRAMLFAELFLAVILVTYILKVIGLSHDMAGMMPTLSFSYMEFDTVIKAYADAIAADQKVGQTLATLVLNLLLMFMMVPSILGVATRKAKSLRGVVRTFVIFAVMNAVTSYVLGADSYVSYFVFNPPLTIAITYCIVLMVLLSYRTRKFYSADPHNVAGPLSWVRYLFVGKPPVKKEADLIPEDDAVANRINDF